MQQDKNLIKMSRTKKKIKRLCVRCESKENISLHLHKTPKAFLVKSRRSYTKITVFEGTGGSGYVPICQRCKKLFSRWKVLHALAESLFIISFIVFGCYLIYLVMDIDPLLTAQNKFIYVQIPTLLSGISLVIFGIAFTVTSRSNSNPHKFIKINYGMTLIKPINSTEWVPVPMTDN